MSLEHFYFFILHRNLVNTIVSALPGCMFSTSVSDSTISATLNLYILVHFSTTGSGNKVSCNHYLIIRRRKTVIYCVHSGSFAPKETTSDTQWRIRFPKISTCMASIDGRTGSLHLGPCIRALCAPHVGIVSFHHLQRHSAPPA
jgi:hypothetical protein